jgi:hypothetical protein
LSSIVLTKDEVRKPFFPFFFLYLFLYFCEYCSLKFKELFKELLKELYELSNTIKCEIREQRGSDHKNITIDDSEDEHIDDIQTITIEELTSSVWPQIVKKCCNCLNKLETNPIDYNDLKSANHSLKECEPQPQECEPQSQRVRTTVSRV